jgi:hypothetical protein
MNLPLPTGPDPTTARSVRITGSKVEFSRSGRPEEFDEHDYVYVSPNDGEDITGAVVIGDYLYVLKPSRMFVFYGVSAQIAGSTYIGEMVHYRAVDLEPPRRRVAWSPVRR